MSKRSDSTRPKIGIISKKSSKRKDCRCVALRDKTLMSSAQGKCSTRLPHACNQRALTCAMKDNILLSSDGPNQQDKMAF